MGHLAQLADVRATRLEADVPWVIEATILAALTPLRDSIHDLIARFTACESRHGESSEVTTLEDEVADIRKDMDYLKSSDFTSLLEAADDDDDPEISKIPSTTTEDVHRDVTTTDERGEEIDEEQIEVREDSIYKDLPDLEETIV
ncbi:hypothetical protein R3W88_008140 [Solanum pinnatisectum]|uniref:Polyprotein protein n=1 Tax=Solanum pinnatisectum TaxID=50273 RepID=A0AAV9MAE8_9SOLN|nr:hypothetical protein R3W88_008140 [Solanum pinnatisectum]